MPDFFLHCLTYMLHYIFFCQSQQTCCHKKLTVKNTTSLRPFLSISSSYSFWKLTSEKKYYLPLPILYFAVWIPPSTDHHPSKNRVRIEQEKKKEEFSRLHIAEGGILIRLVSAVVVLVYGVFSIQFQSSIAVSGTSNLLSLASVFSLHIPFMNIYIYAYNVGWLFFNIEANICWSFALMHVYINKCKAEFYVPVWFQSPSSQTEYEYRKRFYRFYIA